MLTYGGCLIQDLGYYPFGKELFSDLTHYVRSGDFVLALLRDAQNVNELGAAILEPQPTMYKFNELGRLSLFLAIA
jgi:hypothetical protein